MGTVLYLLVAAGFFMLMMRFGCGAHVMGHNQHSNQDADNRLESNGADLATSDFQEDGDRPAKAHDHATSPLGERSHD